MNRVTALVRLHTGSDVVLVRNAASELIASGGKRLRPMLTLAAAYLAGYRGDKHVALAAAVELIHTATLLHDDVVDESDLRRGSPSARTVWGNHASVFVGDFLFGRALRVMVEAGSLDALRVLSGAVNEIVTGEVMQLAAGNSLATRDDGYMAVIRAKTAALFAAASEVGPALAGLGIEERTLLSAYGLNLGLAFQLIDDALDYSGQEAKLGKRVGDDFRNRKVTLPVILAYQRGNSEEKAFWVRTIGEGLIADRDLDAAINYVRRHGALEETVARAHRFGGLAKDALKTLPAGEARSALLEAVDFCISRAH
jgi:octaprenyl-diphosphate synthase